MAANFNLSVVTDPISELELLQYKDAQGVTALIPNAEYVSFAVQVPVQMLRSNIAESYTKKTYPANSLVFRNTNLYYNPNAINTAEDWTAAHWTKTTLTDYIKLMTT